jgi:hypothetical protein
LAPRNIHSNLTPYRFDDFHCQSETPLRVDILEFNSKLTSISLLSGIGLAACGAETAGTAATAASLKAKEIKQGQETKEQIIKQHDDANRVEEQRHKDAENK